MAIRLLVLVARGPGSFFLLFVLSVSFLCYIQEERGGIMPAGWWRGGVAFAVGKEVLLMSSGSTRNSYLLACFQVKQQVGASYKIK